MKITVNLEEKFEEYLGQVYPNYEIMPPLQRKEVRNAFYAGLMEMFTTLNESIGSGEVSEEESEDIMNSIKYQLELFIMEVIESETKKTKAYDA